MEKTRLSSSSAAWHEKLFGPLFDLLMGYGYKTERILYLDAGVWLIGALVFLVAHQNYLLRLASGDVLVSEYYLENKSVPSQFEPFQPALYSLDLLIPFANFQQVGNWAIAQYDSFPSGSCFVELPVSSTRFQCSKLGLVSPNIFQIWYWIQQTIGVAVSILYTLAVAVFSQRLGGRVG